MNPRVVEAVEKLAEALAIITPRLHEVIGSEATIHVSRLAREARALVVEAA